MQSLTYESMKSGTEIHDDTLSMINKQDNNEALQNPYTVMVQREDDTVNWVAYTLGKINNIFWGSFSKGYVKPEYGCKQTKGIRLINDMLKELKENGYVLAGTMAKNRPGALVGYHLDGQKIHQAGLLDKYMEDIMREMGIISETPAAIERAYEKWYYDENPERRNVVRENIIGIRPLLEYIMRTHIDSQKFSGECPSLDTCQKAWDRVCGLYGERSLL